MSDRDVAFDATVATPGSGLGASGGNTVKDRHQTLAEQFIGQILGGRYKLKRIVGAGGFGAVFEGEDQRIKKRVAVKLLFADMLRDREAVIRFKLEAEAASQVGHRHIIDITDFDFTEDGVAYMVMEFLEGEDLAHIIRRAETPDLARVVRLCVQAARGLLAAHRKGIVHRDLKPGNVFVARKEGEAEQVKVVDFGISRASELDEEERLTKTGQILGTPYYMAPEQADGILEVDARADIYAMGVILFEGCTGRLPFIARTPIGLITKHASEPPPDPHSLNAAIPPLLVNVILKCLEKAPVERFQDAGELEQALLHCLATIDPTAAAVEMAKASAGGDTGDRTLSDEALVALTTPPSLLRRTTATETIAPRRPLLLVGVGVGALVLGIVVAVWFLKRPKDESAPRRPAAALGREAPDARPARLAPSTDAGAARPRVRPPMTPPPRLDAGLKAPMAPPTVALKCRTQQGDVRVTDRSERAFYGSCPGVLKVPRGTTPIKLYFHKSGYITWTEEVLPDKDKAVRFLSLTPLRRVSMGRLPDDVIP